MKIIHFSDIHAGGTAEDWLAYLDKRWVGVFNYRFRRRFRHDLSKLEKAVSRILEIRPDVAVCTGDLTSTGQPGEFNQTLAILKPLLESDIPLLFVPGNHDCYVRRDKCVNAMKEAFFKMNQCRFRFDDLPLSLELGDCRFLMVNESWPSNLISSCGYLKKDSEQFLLEECAGEKKRPLILVAHYPLWEDHPLWRIRHRLWGQKKAAALLREKQIDISLCGHVHRPYAKVDDSGRGEICAGSVTRNGSFGIIEFDRAQNRFRHDHVFL